MTANAYTIARDLAAQAVAETRDNLGAADFDAAQEYLHESIDSMDLVIYHFKAIDFCANNDTSDGEAWLEDVGLLTQPGDTFGQIASRVAYATIYTAAEEVLRELQDEEEDLEAA